MILSSDYSKGLAEVFEEDVYGKWRSRGLWPRKRSCPRTLTSKAALTKLESCKTPMPSTAPGHYEEVSKIIMRLVKSGLPHPLLGSDGWIPRNWLKSPARKVRTRLTSPVPILHRIRILASRSSSIPIRKNMARFLMFLPFKATMPVWSSSMHWKKPKVKADEAGGSHC